MKYTKTIIVIPARGGSKGIPRKNLRPLAGRPLIFYSISNAKQIVPPENIYVSTDDEEIKFFALKLGVQVHWRGNNLSNDSATLDPVVINAYNYASKTIHNINFIITMQPTSPLLQASSVESGLEYLHNNSGFDTVLSAIDNSHLSWKLQNGKYVPNYNERLNRQYLPKNLQETGGFVISRVNNIKNNIRIGSNVHIVELNPEEAIDIDSYNDWSLCEFYLKRKHILFRVSGHQEIGLGHIYNCLGLASEILTHQVSFLVDNNSELGYEKIKEYNFPVKMQKGESILDDIKEINPDLVVNDCLNTTYAYVKTLKEAGYKVFNIEDLGEGGKLADVVVNAIYPEKVRYPNHFYGPSYFCSRDEFQFHDQKVINPNVQKVLITFGGVDPNNLTKKVLDSIYLYCLHSNISITVIAGMGYSHYSTLEKFSKIEIKKDVKNISDFFFEADLVFSSAGRTIYELAILGTPTIVLAQNERELTHFFAYEKFGFLNMGLGKNVDQAELLKTFKDYIRDEEYRKLMSSKMLDNEVKKGKEKVKNLILNLIDR